MKASAQQEYVDYVTGRLPTLRRLAYLLCGDEHRADDLVQQTITKLYLRWQRISGVEHLDQYVRTMLVHAFVDERRRPWARVGLVAHGFLTSRLGHIPKPGEAYKESGLRFTVEEADRRRVHRVKIEPASPVAGPEVRVPTQTRHS